MRIHHKEGRNTKKTHTVKQVLPGSIAQEMGLESGDRICTINNHSIEDIFDYRFLIQDTYIEILVEKPDKEQWILEIDKEFDEDLGVEFDNGLMDGYRHCHNKCIFCFIDQLPKGMRETLYFKDDDARLSFLQGNYITLTNMTDQDIDRIIRYHLSPINISFHTMNPSLRCRMLNNPFAGEALKKADTLYAAGIPMNGQIVLCKGVNDGEELEYSIKELSKYLPCMESVSVVPVGLSKHREGLYPLEPFGKEEAKKVLKTIHEWQNHIYKEHGVHFIHAGDEWYLLAGEELPEEERYDGYPQLENGVGMMRFMLEEFNGFLEQVKKKEASLNGVLHECTRRKELTFITGRLAYPYIKKMAEQVMEVLPKFIIYVYPITNYFFGEGITVSGLLTGQDIREQLKGKALGEQLVLPQNVLKSGEDVFLDGMTVADLENALQVPINIVKSSRCDFMRLLWPDAEGKMEEADGRNKN